MYKSFVKHCSFIENEYLYKFVMTSMYLNEAQREREIMELWRNGENNVSIAKVVGYDEKTIRNRKKALVEKYNNLLESNKIFL